jgi:CRP-like cAMP-binding protein
MNPTPERLQGIPFFADLPADSLEAVAALASEVTVPPGHVLVERGFPGSGMFLIEAGMVEVDLGPDRHVELGPGAFFGELSLLTERQRTARVHALTQVRCLAIGRVDFIRLLESQPGIGLAMLKTLAERLAEAQASP